MRFFFFILLLTTPLPALTQQVPNSFLIRQDIPLQYEGRQLALGWVGGLNAPQISKIDLNGDAVEDLFIFDRTQSRVKTFVASNESWVYAPEYEALFPLMSGWALLRDFDRDGDKDLFTSQRFGVQVLENVAETGAPPSFVPIAAPLLTKGRSGDSINLRIDLTDIAHFGDVDGDGDLDVLNFTPSVGFSIEYHRNFSVEQNGDPTQLLLEKVDFQWGGLTECDCFSYGFGGNPCRVAEAEHAGSTTLAFDADNDGDQDLLVGDVDCTNLSFLENKGTPTEAEFTEIQLRYPTETPAELPLFPAPFLEDVTFDNVPDLLIAPNLFFNEDEAVDFRQSLWLYQNSGTTEVPRFTTLQKRDFLQEQMLDLGENARPTFTDWDNDGDDDLLIGYKGQPSDEGLRGGVAYFENTGTNTRPAFRYQTELCPELGCEGLSYVKVSARAGVLVVWGYDAAARKTQIRQYSEGESQPLTGLNLSSRDDIALLDWNEDGNFDLLVGGREGNLTLYQNNGNQNFTPQTEALGGITGEAESRTLRVAVGDLNENGEPDLVRGDQSGALAVYFDIRRQPERWEATPVAVFSPLTQEDQVRNWGSLPSPAVWQGNLVLGTGGGGLHFLRNRQLTSQPAPEPKIELEVYPNPAANALRVRFDQPGWLSVTDVRGRTVKTEQFYTEDTSLTLPTQGWASGVYLVRLRTAEGIRVKRFVKR